MRLLIDGAAAPSQTILSERPVRPPRSSLPTWCSEKSERKGAADALLVLLLQLDAAILRDGLANDVNALGEGGPGKLPGL